MAAFGRSREPEWRKRADVDVEPLADLWRRALSAGLHGAGCACGLGGFALTADDLEADILDFLAARYKRDDAPDVANVLAERRNGGPLTFPTWLEDIKVRLDIKDWARLDGDVRTVLTSIGGADGPFICT